MFGVGPLELLLILLVAVLVLGPEHLPKVMRTVTKLVANYRRVSTELQRNINLEANKEEYRQKYGKSELDEEPVKKKVKKKKTVKKVKKAVEPAPDNTGRDSSRSELPGDTSGTAAPAAVEKAADENLPADNNHSMGEAAPLKEKTVSPPPSSAKNSLDDIPVQGGRA